MSTLSLCMIVKNEEPTLRQCLDSVRGHVNEVIVVDTGSTDKSVAIAKECGAVVHEVTPETHPSLFYLDEETQTYCLGDFSAARNLSFSYATSDFILWLDGDDVLVGGQNLASVVEVMDRDDLSTACMKYEYSYNQAGQVMCLLWRERIIRRGVGIQWTNPIHEILEPVNYSSTMWASDLYVRHMRTTDKVQATPNRNYKILKRHYERDQSDPRTLFYIGNEARFSNPNEAIWAYEEYLKRSGWPEEKAVAHISVGQLYENRNSVDEAIRHYEESTKTDPKNPDGHFALARIAYFKEEWSECIRHTENGLMLNDSKSVMMHNPLDRHYTPHIYYNYALGKTGKFWQALMSCKLGLAHAPGDEWLTNNAAFYTSQLAKRRTRHGDNLTIIFYLGQSVEVWSPQSIKTTGIGGSETAAVEMAKELAALGHKVTVVSDCGDMAGMYDGVAYADYKDPPEYKCDVFIASRRPEAATFTVDATLKYLWMHDTHVGQASEIYDWFAWFDKILCVSEWHKEFVLDMYPRLHKDKVCVTRNGIDVSRFVGSESMHRSNTIIYSSSADRGLDELLRLFPRIRREVPDVELHVYYGFETWERVAKWRGDLESQDRIKWYKAQLANTPGVVAYGRVDQKTLARAFMDAKLWTYPTHFTETSCISAMEAQAAGCVPITTALAALRETVKHGILISRDGGNDLYDDVFVQTTVRLLQMNDIRSDVARRGISYAKKSLGWDLLAQEWVAMFRRQADEN